MIAFLRSVKFRLTLWYAFVLAILLSVFGLLTRTELQRALYRDVDEKLEAEANRLKNSFNAFTLNSSAFNIPAVNVKGNFSNALTHESSDKLRAVAQRWNSNVRDFTQTTMLVRFLGGDHSVILSNLSGWETDIIFPDFERDSVFMETGVSFQTIHFQKKPIRLFYLLIKLKDEPLFVMQLGTSLADVQSALQRLSFITWITIPGAVAITVIAGWFLARRSFRPVDLMIREARQISAAYLQSRLPRSGTGDEVDRLAGTLNEMLDRIESSTRAVQEFSSDISHELRTPLAIIKGEIDLALRRVRTPEALVETLRVVDGELDELIRLVDDLMILVRSDARKLKFDLKPLKLKPVLETVAERFRDRAEQKKLLIETRLNSCDPSIEGDDTYLKRLFSNLLDNAIKFTPPGGKIVMALSVDKDKVVVQVTDTGMGIEASLQSKVFARFYRTDQARAVEGSGLGLNIVKAICDGHQGSINLTSKPGVGTSVQIILPKVISN